MPRVCTVCIHAEREAIDRALVAGEAARTLASRYVTIGRMAMQRHKDEHLPPTLAQAQQAQDAAHGGDLLARLEGLTADARRIQRKAEAAGEYRTALAGIRELVRIVEVLAELRGELDRRPVNIVVMPEWAAVRSTLLTALQPFPEARGAVAGALMQIEATNGHRG